MSAETCVRCAGKGVIEYVSGEHWTSGNSYSGPQKVTATEERPVYRPCSCRDEKRKSEPAAPAAAERFTPGG